MAALNGTADEKLTGLVLRIVLSDHIDIPHENQPDFLTEAEQVLAPKKPKRAMKPTAFKNAKAPSAKKTPTLKKAA